MPGAEASVFQIFQILTAFLVALAMAFPLAHAAELPGKQRLSKEEYLAIQPIYYPGFTLGGLIGEFGGIVTTLILTILTPMDDPAFWWTAGSLLSLLLMHAVYWVMTHPVNNFWLKDVRLDRTSFGFFAAFAPKTGAGRASSWTALRDQWEYSHAVRAAFGVAGLILILIAITR
jgi:hypothetical protein